MKAKENFHPCDIGSVLSSTATLDGSNKVSWEELNFLLEGSWWALFN